MQRETEGVRARGVRGSQRETKRDIERDRGIVLGGDTDSERQGERELESGIR